MKRINAAARMRAFAAAHVPGSSITPETIMCRTVAYEPEVKENAPHPDSYRPDLPLRSQVTEDPYQLGYDEGYDAGHAVGEEEAESLAEAEARGLRRELMDARDRIATLEGALETMEAKIAAFSRSAPRAAEG
jgi:ATP-dependent exoDNAse (exonuclease V) beta subunit